MNTTALPMSSQLSTRCALALVAAMAVASAIGVLALGPMAGAQAHRLADPGIALGIRNGSSVLSQAPLLLAALGGLMAMRRAGVDPPRRLAWTAFFGMVALGSSASMLNHLMPSNAGHFLAELPAASAGALLAALFFAERIRMAWIGPVALGLALASGPMAGAVWLAGELLWNQPDYRLLLWLDCLPMLLLPLGAWNLPSRGLHGRHWTVALLWFAAAQLADWNDLAMWEASQLGIGSQLLQHLPLAVCVAWLAWCVARQRAVREPAGSAGSQRQTSFITAG